MPSPVPDFRLILLRIYLVYLKEIAYGSPSGLSMDFTKVYIEVDNDILKKKSIQKAEHSTRLINKKNAADAG